MSSRDNILKRLREVEIAEVAKPQLDIIPIRFENKVTHFIKMVEAVGGNVVKMQGSLVETLATLNIGVENLVSSLDELQNKALNPDSVADVHELGGNYTAVVCGRVAVAENGAVWIPILGKRKAHVFACNHLVVVMNREYIVDTMHDAIIQLSLDNLAYGVFVSGPSKTADIEQALVIGAHGAMQTTIILL